MTRTVNGTGHRVLARTAFRVGQLERAPVRGGLRRVVVAAQIDAAEAQCRGIEEKLH